MRRSVTILALVLALVVAAFLAALFTQPRPKLTVRFLEIVPRHGSTILARFAVTNMSSRSVIVSPGVEEVMGNLTNRILGAFEGSVSLLGPGEGEIIGVLVFDKPDHWRAVLESSRPLTDTRRLMANLRQKFAPGVKIGAIDKKFLFSGPWRTGTKAEPGDVVTVSSAVK